MADIESRRVRRRRRLAEKEFVKCAKAAKATEESMRSSMRTLRGMGQEWLAIIEEIERDPIEAARLPNGIRDACEIIIERSADVELALGDALAAYLSAHESILSIEVGA